MMEKVNHAISSLLYEIKEIYSAFNIQFGLKSFSSQI